MTSTTRLEATNTLGDPLVLDPTPKDDQLKDQPNPDTKANESGDQDRLKTKGSIPLFATREVSSRGHMTNSDPSMCEPKEHSFSFQSVGMS